MLDAYERITLEPGAKGLFKKTFTVPDTYGIFKFRVHYRRPGYTVLSFSTQVCRLGSVFISGLVSVHPLVFSCIVLSRLASPCLASCAPLPMPLFRARPSTVLETDGCHRRHSGWGAGRVPSFLRERRPRKLLFIIALGHQTDVLQACHALENEACPQNTFPRPHPRIRYPSGPSPTASMRGFSSQRTRTTPPL